MGSKRLALAGALTLLTASAMPVSAVVTLSMPLVRGADAPKAQASADATPLVVKASFRPDGYRPAADDLLMAAMSPVAAPKLSTPSTLPVHAFAARPDLAEAILGKRRETGAEGAEFVLPGAAALAAFPILSTFAMMFLGFAALGLAGYRSRRDTDIAAS